MSDSGMVEKSQQQFCRFPNCRCPMDPGPSPDWCAIGLPHRGMVEKSSLPSFTKGPWEVATALSLDLIAIYSHDGYRVGAVHDFNGRPENKANARLIAAAPDLLRACEAMSAHYSGSLDHQPAFVALARAAIQKAIGEQS